MPDKSNDDVFDRLPKFDPSEFQPPAWANGPAFDFTRKNGESSRSGRQTGPDQSSAQHGKNSRVSKYEEDDLSDDGEEVWEDARSGLEESVEVTDEGLAFTLPEMKRLVGLAKTLKDEGNQAYTSKIPNLNLAIEKYQAALKHLPPIPKSKPKSKSEGPSPEKPTPTPAPIVGSGIQEITDEEAEALQSGSGDESGSGPGPSEDRDPGEVESEDVEEQIRELGKACYGNMAACWAGLKEDKKVVEACNQALEIDPGYTKALHRRATANDRIGSWSSLTSAKQDYEKLMQVLPRSSPQYPTIRSALATLPRRIATQQDKEKDEMMGQLKELGNGILGKFGLSTDMFKFEQQEGGGYGLKFER